MSVTFTHTARGQRVLFGHGRDAGHPATEVDRLRARKVMVIADARTREPLRRRGHGLRAQWPAAHRLRRTVHAPKALTDYGFTTEGIPDVVTQALAKIPDSNPRPVTEDNLTALLATTPPRG